MSRWVILGAGGHGRVLMAAIRRMGGRLAGLIDPGMAPGTLVLGVPVLGDDAWLAGADPAEIHLANGLGLAGWPTARQTVFETWSGRGFRFPVIVDPSAVVAEQAVLGEGCQILPGVIIQPGAAIGRDTIINTRAVIEHDCRIGAHSHIAPGAVLCGNVQVGSRAHVGAAAVIRQGLRVGDDAMVGIGAAVVKDVGDGLTVAGNPARALK